MSKSHLFSAKGNKQQKVYKGGSSTSITASNFPALTGMSMSLLKLDPQCIREPHWTLNAQQFNYCLKGTGFVTIFGHGNAHDSFIIQAGDVFFIPKNYIYHIENTGDTSLEILECFNHEHPEYIDLSSGISLYPSNILAQTLDVTDKFLQGLHKTKEGLFITKRDAALHVPVSYMTNRYKMNLENSAPSIVVEGKGGSAKVCNSAIMPTITEITAYSVLLRPNGAREPHWHPNADELNYLASGTAKVSLIAPGGKYEEFEMQAGDVSFLPSGQLHHLENIGDDDARFIVFFNHEKPMDIGISGTFGAFSNEVLASLFGVPPSYFKDLKKYQTDLFVIGGG